MKTSDMVAVSVIVLSVIVIVIAESQLSIHKQPFIDRVQQCKDAGGIPIYAYALTPAGWQYPVCLNPSALVELHDD